MSAPAPRQAPADDPRPKESGLFWAVVAYVDGELGNGLDMARAALAKAAKKEGKVISELVKSPTKTERFDSRRDGQDVDGNPVMRQVRHCKLYVVAVCRPAPPEKWVRLTTSIGPAAVEVATVEKGRVVKVDEYHPEDMRHVAMGYAQRALEGAE